jgi:hypothetical protein
MFDSFQPTGTLPDEKEELKRFERGAAISMAVSFRSLLLTPSHPLALVISRPLRIFRTSAWVVIIEDRRLGVWKIIGGRE